MAEGKKRTFTRKAAIGAVIDMVERVRLINEGKADYPFLNKVKDVILFGSLVNNPKTKTVHDADIAVFCENDPEKRMEFYHLYPEYRIHGNDVRQMFSEYLLMKKYISGNSHILSLHESAEEGEGVRENIVMADQHIWLFKDYMPCEDAISELKNLY